MHFQENCLTITEKERTSKEKKHVIVLKKNKKNIDSLSIKTRWIFVEYFQYEAVYFWYLAIYYSFQNYSLKKQVLTHSPTWLKTNEDEENINDDVSYTYHSKFVSNLYKEKHARSIKYEIISRFTPSSIECAFIILALNLHD